MDPRPSLTASESLVDSLILIARSHRLPATRESLTGGLPAGDAGLTPDLLVRAAGRAGINARLVKLSLDDVPDSVCPAMILMDDGSASVFWGRTEPEMAQVTEPAVSDEQTEVRYEDFKARASGFVLLARPRSRLGEDETGLGPESLIPPEGGSQWFWSLIKQNAGVYRDVIVAAFFVNLFSLAFFFYLRIVFDRVIPNAAFETLWVLTSGVILVFIASLIVRILRAFFIELASRRLEITISARMMERVLGMRMEAKPARVGSFAAVMKSFDSLRDFTTSATLISLIELPFACLFLAVIVWVSWQMAIPVVIGLIVLLAFAAIMHPRLRHLAEVSFHGGAARNAALIESLTGLETLKATAAESMMQERWEDATRFLAATGVNQRTAANVVSTVTWWVQQVVAVSVIVLGVYLIAAGQLTFGGLILCKLLALRCISPFTKVAGLVTGFQQAKLSLGMMNRLFATPTEHLEEGAFLSRERFQGKLEFQNLSFAYPGAHGTALRGVTLKINSGERVALLGRVGSGKSTLQKLTMGLYQPSEGAVLVDDIDLRQLEPREYRSAVGYSPQDVTLFNGTLRENLVLAKTNVSDADLIRAVELAGLSEFVNRHPLGFDMPVSERGESISGGQRRCMGLARALVTDSNILILDEPTGSMDNATERTVISNLKTFVEGKTLVVVTHRNSILELVDRIVVLDNGKIVADGPRETVLSALKKGQIGRVQ